eukprot:jgi/Tetstr1/435560/TSEL_024463.t1
MIRNGVRISFKNGPPAPFNQGVSMEDATPDQLRFMDEELARFLASGAWEKGHGLRMSFETLTRLCHLLARPDDYMLSMDLQDGFHAVGIAPEDRDYFTDSWSGRVKMTRQLRRDLECMAVTVPNHSNGCSIYKPVDTAYMHFDSSGYGRGAVLNETTEARGIWYAL